MAVANENLSTIASQWASIAVGGAISAADHAAFTAGSTEGGTKGCSNHAGIEHNDSALSPNLDSLSPITEEGRIIENSYSKRMPADAMLEQDGRLMPQLRLQAEHIEGKMSRLMKEVGQVCNSFEREVGALKEFEEYQKKHCKAVAALVSEDLRGFFDQEFLKLRSLQEQQFTALSMMVCDMLDADVSTVRGTAKEATIHTKVAPSAFIKPHFCDTAAKTGASEVRGMQSRPLDPEDMALTTSAGPALLQTCSAKEKVATLAALLPVSRAQSTSSRASPQPAASSRASDPGSSLMSPASVARGLSLSACVPAARPCIEMGTIVTPSHSARGGLSGLVPSTLWPPAAQSATILNSAGMACGRQTSLSGSISLPAAKPVTYINPASTARPASSLVGVHSSREKESSSCATSPRPAAPRSAGVGTQRTVIRGSATVPLARPPTRPVLPMRRSCGWSSPNDLAKPCRDAAAPNGASIDVRSPSPPGIRADSVGQRRSQEFRGKTIDV